MMSKHEKPLPTLPAMFSPALIKDVSALIDHAGLTGQLTTGWETIQELLLAAGVAPIGQNVKGEFMGVSQYNRSKLGVGGSEAQVHGADILQEGYSHKKASDATAIEVPPPPHDEE